MVKKTKIAISKYAKQNRVKRQNFSTSKIEEKPVSQKEVGETHYAFIEKSYHKQDDEVHFAGDVHKIMVVGNDTKQITQAIADNFDYIQYPELS